MTSTLELTIQRREETLSEIRRLLIDSLHVPRDPDEIDPDTLLFGSGLGLDSIDAVELLVCLAADFGVKLPNSAVGRAELRSVNSLVDLVLATRKAEHEDA
jgi:acyl carrier protein